MTISVSTIVADEHGITASPGKKGECPFCHRSTFSISRDDSVGKCFHPVCGKFISGAQKKNQQDSTIYQIHDELFQEFHGELLSLQGSEKKNAYKYITRDRSIHPKVVADSMIGVIPADYDVDKFFSPHIERLQKEKEEEAAEQKKNKKKGRPKKKKGPPAAMLLKLLVEAQEKLEKCLKRHGGWLAFFYTDAYHRIVSIRFRKPYAGSSNSRLYKPFFTGGIFNRELYIPTDSPGRTHLNELLIIVEGEFNQLQLQSLFVRVAESKGDPTDTCYVFSCAVGGVNNADLKTIREVAPNPIVCYDNDAGEAGSGLVKNLVQETSLTAFTTPEVDSDLDDYIRSFGSDIEKAYASFRELVAERKLHIRPFEALKGEIDKIRSSEGGKAGPKPFEVNRKVSEIIIADLEDRGVFYHDQQLTYFFNNSEKRLATIEPDNQDLELILSRYGLIRSELIYKYALNILRLHALENGQVTEVFTLSHYNQSSGILYVYDFDQQIYRITCISIERVDNGTDGVLFAHNSGWEPYTVGTANPGQSTLNRVVLEPIKFAEKGLSIEDTRLLFEMWLYCLFFPEKFPTRPILAMIGDMGSGKTSGLRKVGQLLFGSSFNVMQLSEDSKDFDAAVTGEPFVAIDNADSKVKWLDDRLAVAATGGKVKRREYFTTNRLVEFPVCAFLAVTSRTPHFRRPDVADRLLVFYVDRLDTFVPESQMLAELVQFRDEIWTEVISRLQELVRVFQDQKGKNYSSQFRMADFADFCLRIAHTEGWGERMEAILEQLKNMQTSFAMQDEPIFDLLDIWLNRSTASNIGREVTTAQLCKELTAVAEENDMHFFFKGNTKALGRRLTNITTLLDQIYVFRDRTVGGRKRLLSFRPKSPEPSLFDA